MSDTSRMGHALAEGRTPSGGRPPRLSPRLSPDLLQTARLERVDAPGFVGAASPVAAPMSDEKDDADATPSGEPCRACGAAASGTYCTTCGTRLIPRRLTGAVLGRQFLDRVLNVESGLLRTLWDLTVDPGGTAQRYVDGQRALYVNPMGYFAFVATVSVLLFVAFKADYIRMSAEASAEEYGVALQAGEGLETVLSASGFGGAAARNDARASAASEEPSADRTASDADARADVVNQFLFESIEKYYSVISFIQCFIIALILRIVMRRTRFNSVETLVFALYVIGHASLIVSLLTPMVIVIDPYLASTLSVLVPLPYVAYGTSRFYETRGAAWWGGAVWIISNVAVFVLIVAVVAAYLVASGHVAG